MEGLEVARARADVWKFAHSFVYTDVLQTIVELEIPDVLEKHGGSMSLAELSSAVGCSSPESLNRIMRFLAHQGVFRRTKKDDSSVFYAQTALSGLLVKAELAPFILLPKAAPQGPYNGISAKALRAREDDAFVVSNGEDIWTDEAFGKHQKLFTEAMDCHARWVTSTIIQEYPNIFKGIDTLVDVGGRHGVALGLFLKAFPWIQGINFDLPPIVAEAPIQDPIVHIGGSMFERVPKGDAIMLMSVLHDWGDDMCIEILKKCREAMASNDGKVVILDAVIDEDGEGDMYTGARLGQDMVMMNVTVKGKERTSREWEHLIKEAGYSRFTVKNIPAIESVIEAYL